MTLKLKIGPTFRTQTLRLVHRLGGELRMALSFTLGLALLHHFVASVISHGPKFQMVRITAGWVVAFMTNDHSDGNLAFVNYVRNAMGKVLAIPVSHFSVPVITPSTVPQPARLSFLYLVPEFLFKGLAVLKATFATAEVRSAPLADLPTRSEVLFAAFTALKRERTASGDTALQGAGTLSTGKRRIELLI